MVKLCQFIESSSETQVLVNPESVRVVREGYDEPNTSRIEFDQTHRIIVQGDTKSVWKALADATRT